MIKILSKWINEQVDFGFPEKYINEVTGRSRYKKVSSLPLLKQKLLILNEKANRSPEEFFLYAAQEKERILKEKEQVLKGKISYVRVLRFNETYFQLLEKAVEQVLSVLDLENINKQHANPLDFIQIEVQDLFRKAEKKALGEAEKFNSNVRCAAFCELLYEKHYIKRTKNNRVLLNKFALGRYGIDITDALASSKNAQRKKHKSKTVKGQKPLEECF